MMEAYLNCKYPYWRFKKVDTKGLPLLTFILQDWIDEVDPMERVKEKTERLKLELKHKRYGTPLPPKQITIKYQPRFANA